MADFTTGAGGTFSLSAGTPTTFDEAGYDALTYTTIGKVTAATGLPKRTYNEVVVNYLASAGEDVAKGSYSLGNTTITIALDSDDAGQTLVRAANDSTATYSVKLAHPTHATRYAQALVFIQDETWGDNDTPSTMEVMLRFKVATATEDGVVSVAAT